MALPIRRATPQRPPSNKGNSRFIQAPVASVVVGTRATIIRAAQKSAARRAGNDLNSGLGPLARGGAQWIQAPKYNSGGLKPSLIRPAAQKSRTWRAVSDTNQSVGPVTAVRGGTQWIQAPTAVVSVPDGDQPSVFLAVRPLPPTGQGRSRSYITSTATVGAGQRPNVIRAAQKSVARRTGNDLNSGLGPIVRGGAQWIQAPQYNSGGLAPRVLAGRRQAISLRTDSRALPYGYKTGRGSHWRPAQVYNSGGLVPTRVQGLKRPAPIRPIADLNGGIGPVAVTRGGSQWVQSPLPVPATTPVIAQGVRRKPSKVVGPSRVSGFAIPKNYPYAVLADNPLAYYRLDETGSTFVDVVGGHNGTGSGGYASTAGLLSQLPGNLPDAAVSFNGSTGRIDLPSGYDPSAGRTTFSLEFWFQPAGIPASDSRLIANAHTDSDKLGFQAWLSGSGTRLDVAVGLTSVWAGAGVNLTFGTARYQVGFSYDGSQPRLFINGLQVAVGGINAGTIAAASFPISFARNPAYNGDYFAGVIDEVSFYGQALGADRFLAHYLAGAAPPVAVLSSGIRRPVPSRPVADLNGGLGPTINLRGGSQWIQVPQVLLGAAPILVRGQLRKPSQAGRSHLLAASSYNAGGLVPIRSQALRQALPKRAASRLVLQPPSSVPITPVVLRARRQAVPQRALSHRLPAAAYNAGGLTPSLVRALRRPAAKVRPARLVVPPPLAAVIPDGDQPSLFSATRAAAAPTRPASRWLRPVQLPAVSSAAVVLRGVPRKPAKVGPSHSFRPAYNGSGIAPQLSQGIRRHPGPVGPSRWRPAPGYNAGGLVPQRTRGVPRKPGPVKASHQLVAQLYNSGGLKPLFRAGLRQRPPTRGRSHSWLAPIAETATQLRYYLQDQEPNRSLSSAEANVALLDQEPIKGLTSNRPSRLLIDNEPNQSPGTGIKGQ
ncbi:MAG: hypothetical protein DLM66_00170 [Candidatus Dormiibacter spiritus]|nr:MAG: hypothetical protein DLM66_00170 [Candidatus Dormibacteraeota bacterium]